MEPESLLYFSRWPATGPYPEPHECVHPRTLFQKNIILAKIIGSNFSKAQ
jgi:hypothetical protein